MRTGAIVYPFSGTAPEEDLRRLEAFRATHAGIRLFVVELDGSSFPGPCDRRISLPLTAAHREIAATIGLQLCLNEGHDAAGTITGLSGADLEAAASCLDLLLADKADAVIRRGQGPAPDSIFASARAAFACSFWGGMAQRLKDIRQEVLAQIFGMNGLRLFTMDSDGAGVRPRTASPAGMALLTSHADELFRVLGVSAGPVTPPRSPPVTRIAVVTPYYKEPDAELQRCLDSVRQQSLAADHILVSDGVPNPIVARAGVMHIELGTSHADNGNTPRYVGGLTALALGYDGIAYLDADNWYEPHHIKRLAETQHQTFANAVCSFRNIHLPDGYKLPQMDGEDVQRAHVDTSCYLLTRDCAFIAHLWGQMPRSWGPVCDRVAFAALRRSRLAWTGNRTLNFKSNYAFHFRLAGRPLPERIHKVPTALLKEFADPGPAFRTESISRTARLFSILSPYARKSRQNTA